MAYYMLYARVDDAATWAPQFGDEDRSAVEVEARDWVDGLKREGFCATLKAHTRIIRYGACPSNATLTAEMADLNAEAAANGAG